MVTAALAADVASAGLGKLAQTIDPNLAKTLAGVDVDAATTLADTGETAAKTARILSNVGEQELKAQAILKL